jgi:uncharacterized membrane protein YkvA (DUF1232 family)
MDKIEYNREKQIEASSDQAPDTITVFTEKERSYRRRSEDSKSIWDYLELLFSMLSDIFSGRYPIPIKTILVGTFTLLYLISPIDIIPDIIPLLGFVDDIAVLAFATRLIKDDLEGYRAWKMIN